MSKVSGMFTEQREESDLMQQQDIDEMEEREQQSSLGKPFLFVGEVLALDLVNTEARLRRKPLEFLTTPEDALHWWQAARLHYPQRDVVVTEQEADTEKGQDWKQARDLAEHLVFYDEELLDALKTLRRALRAIFSALIQDLPVDEADLHILNEVLKTGYTALKATGAGEYKSVYYAMDVRKGAVLFPIALSAMRLIESGERTRLHQCANERCILLFYDTTRSATRRWHDIGCMDRARSLQRYQKVKFK